MHPLLKRILDPPLKQINQPIVPSDFILRFFFAFIYEWLCVSVVPGSVERRLFAIQSLLISLTLLMTNGFLLFDAVLFNKLKFLLKNAFSRTDNRLLILIATC